jgi:hypothetical protein
LAADLVLLYNKLIDEARSTGSIDPLLTEDVHAKAQPTGYATTSGPTALATLAVIRDTLEAS